MYNRFLYENDSFKVEIMQKRPDISNEKLDTSFNAIKNALLSINSTNKTTTSISETVNTAVPNVKSVIERKRLPNDDEIKEKEDVLLPTDKDDKVNIVNKSVTGHRLYMCPNCRQSMSIINNGHIVIRDIESKENTNYILKSDNEFKNNKDILALKPEELGAFIEQEDVIITNDENCQSTCLNCGKTANNKAWIDEYIKNKSNISDICPVCGGDLVYTVINGTQKTPQHKCDKCGYIVKEEQE